MSGSDEDVAFRFESPGIRVELEGPRSFVEAQMALVRERVLRELAAATRGDRPTAAASRVTAVVSSEAPAHSPLSSSSSSSSSPSSSASAAATPAAAGDSLPALADFHKRARSREGRGALQETILIFAYYLREVQSHAEFSIHDIATCFDVARATPPSNLANTLGVMKRDRGFFEAGDGRGLYALTDKGAAYVRRLIGAQR